MITKQLAPVKVDADTDRLLSETAHFLHKSKKDVLAEALREYVASQREQLHRSMIDTMRVLDGTDTARISLMTGLSPKRIAELGGIGE
jgi:hypothetical protein